MIETALFALNLMCSQRYVEGQLRSLIVDAIFLPVTLLTIAIYLLRSFFFWEFVFCAVVYVGLREHKPSVFLLLVFF